MADAVKATTGEVLAASDIPNAAPEAAAATTSTAPSIAAVTDELTPATTATDEAAAAVTTAAVTTATCHQLVPQVTVLGFTTAQAEIALQYAQSVLASGGGEGLGGDGGDQRLVEVAIDALLSGVLNGADAGTGHGGHAQQEEPGDSDDGDYSTEEGSDDDDDDDWCKMVFAVNQSLGMSQGKVAAQVAHAALDLWQTASTCRRPVGKGVTATTTTASTGPGTQRRSTVAELAKQWMATGATKIVLKAKNSDQLVALSAVAMSLGLPFSNVTDAGRTEIAAGSHTVFAVFGPIATVDKVTGSLRLLK
eukprot:m.498812 g.498812  ORF g.498812 m.498812 type:complete len:307 (-) comp55517_c0_seq1:105-1025(-)